MSSVKKKPRTCRLSDANKKIRAMRHIEGENCNCKRSKCFENVTLAERSSILTQFNLLGCKDTQSSYLCGLISVNPIHRRRPRKNEAESNLRDHSYSYKVRVIRGDVVVEVPVCHKAFISIHGITNKTVCTLKNSLSSTGRSPQDQRGKHKSHKQTISPETKSKVFDHIKSLKGRRSHYSLHGSKKIYLPAELSVKQLHSMYMKINPSNPVSYEYINVPND